MFYERLLSQTRGREGFSLTELMIVLVIIGMLAGVIAVNVHGHLQRAKQKVARLEISRICAALEDFNAEYGRYPTEEEGLESLTIKSEKFPEPPLEGGLTDPWGHPYQYNCPGRERRYEVMSLGGDGREGGGGIDEDICSWQLKQGPAE